MRGRPCVCSTHLPPAFGVPLPLAEGELQKRSPVGAGFHARPLYPSSDILYFMQDLVTLLINTNLTFFLNKKPRKTQMKIKPLAVNQLPEYAEVIRQSFATVANDFGYTLENCPRHTSFITNQRLLDKISENYYPFGCFVGKKIIGFASITDVGNGIYEMNHVSILPEYRHLKYGAALLNFCKAKVIELGGSSITLSFIEESTVLKSWYISNGFVHMGAKSYEGLPFTVGYMKWEKLK